MNSIRHLWIVIALCATWPAMACSDRDKPPRDIVLPALHTKAIYVDQSWPGELAPVPLSMGVPIAYRERPECAAPVVGTLHLPLDTPLCPGGDPGVLYRSLAPMIWIFTADVTIDLLPIETGHRKPSVDADHQRSYYRKKDSQVEVVKYEGEGNYIARVDELFYNFVEPSVLINGNGVAQWTVKSEGRSEIWFEVSTPGAKRQRWILDDAKTLMIDTHG